MESLFGILISPGPELFRIGPLIFRWYGLLIAISIFIGLNLSNYLAKKRSIPNGLINDLMPILVLTSIIGARIYYVIFEWRNYVGNNFWSYFNIFTLNIPIPRALEIWGGGIAIHGALISGVITVIFFCKFKNQNLFNFSDVLLPSVVLGQAIGRWGNFFNNEAFGIPTTLPWKLFIPLNSRPLIFLEEEYFHPTFLYESLWNVFIFCTLIFLFRFGLKNKLIVPHGTVSFIYLMMYSFGRFIIEHLRIDPLCINAAPPFCEGGIRVAQLMSIILFCLGLTGLVFIYKKRKRILLNQSKNNPRV